MSNILEKEYIKVKERIKGLKDSLKYCKGSSNINSIKKMITNAEAMKKRYFNLLIQRKNNLS